MLHLTGTRFKRKSILIHSAVDARKYHCVRLHTHYHPQIGAQRALDGNLIFVVKGDGRLCEFSMRWKETCKHTGSAVWCETAE